MQTINLSGADLIGRKIAFVHEQPVREDIRYIVSNPYSVVCRRGKWHINNIFPSLSAKKQLSLPCMI